MKHDSEKAATMAMKKAMDILFEAAQRFDFKENMEMLAQDEDDCLWKLTFSKLGQGDLLNNLPNLKQTK